MGLYSAVVSTVNERVFRWKGSVLVYPPVLLVGLIVRFTLSEKVIDNIRTNIFPEDNTFNIIFANHSFQIFTILWLMIFFMHVLKDFTRSKFQSLLPTAIQHTHDTVPFKSKSIRAWQLILSFFLKYSLTLASIVGILTLRHYIQETYGMNISGHYISIVTLSITIIWETRSSISDADILELENSDGLDKRTLLIYAFLSGVLLLCASILAIWLLVLFVTAVFYHTAVEKLIGLIWGYVTPLLIFHGLSYLNIDP